MNDELLVSLSELAERKGVSTQAIHKRVKGLEAEGRLTTVKRGRSRMVDMAEYDRVVGEVGDAVREAAIETVKPDNGSARLRDQQAELAAYKTRMAAMDLADREGNTLPLEGPAGLNAAVNRIGVEMAQDIDALVNADTRLAEAVAKGGAISLRKELKKVAGELRTKLAKRLSALADIGARAEREAWASEAGSFETEIET